MPKYQTTVRSSWTAERAFEYLLDLEHFTDWDPGVKRSARVAGSEPGLGAAFDVTVSAPGKDLTLRYETVAVNPPRRFEVRAETSMLRSVDVISIEPDARGAGCLVSYVADLALKGPLRIGDPLLTLAFRRIGNRAATGLRAVLDGDAA